MEAYVEAFLNAITGTLSWTWKSIIFNVPWYLNYFWGLILISLIVWILEIVFPWRKNQGVFRKDFWLDGFYMFFNFFLFAIAISGIYKILGVFFEDIGIKANSLALIDISNWPMWGQLLLFFIVLDSNLPSAFLIRDLNSAVRTIF